MSSQSKLNQVDRRTKYVVFGWIRETMDDMQQNVPLCIQYLHMLYIGKIDGENTCPYGYSLKVIKAKRRSAPQELLCTDGYQKFYIQCDLCSYQNRPPHNFISKLYHCSCKKCKKNGGYDICYPKCLDPHQGGVLLKGPGNCGCKKCRDRNRM